MKKLFGNIVSILALSTLLVSCGEEVLTQNTLSESYSADDLETFQYNTCAAMRFVKPPVDILFVVDNSGSTLQDSFQQIKGQIAATVSTISNEFDYHVYIAPLFAGSGDDIHQYPLIVADAGTLTNSYLSYNLVELSQVNSSTFFSQVGGNNLESGFERVYDVINSNRSNGIFRSDANTISVLISNGYDTDVMPKKNGRIVYEDSVFNAKKNQFNNLSSALSAESFKFISLVPHQACNSWPGYAGGSSQMKNYKQMSQELGSTSVDLCSQNYSSLFSVVNNSIHQVLVGHKYDHWKISSASEADIQADDITVTKVLPDGSQVNIPEGTQNGFEYLGFQNNINTRYAPDAGEPVTGLVIKLNGNARVEYDEATKKPECIIAKTRTPTEYFGYVVLPREPQLGTIKIEINGTNISNNATNGWSYEGYKIDTNIKVSQNGASASPEVKKTGYFIKLSGNAIFSNGDKINVYYKPKSI